MKIRTAYNHRTPFSTIISIMLFIELIYIEYLECSIYTLIQYVLLIPIILYCISNIKNIKRDSWIELVMLGITLLCIVISSYRNKVEGFYLRAAIYYGLLIFSMCCYLNILAAKEKVTEFLNIGKIYLSFILMINDMLMLLFPSRFYNIHGRDIGTCLLGNKFNVAYWHLMLMFILLILEKNIVKQRRKLSVCVIFMSILCIFIECTTVLLAVWVFAILYYLPKKIKRILSNPVVYITAFFTGAFLLLTFSEILTFGPIKYLIVNVLHRDVTLTGRMEVYAYIKQLVAAKPWFGYGYGTSIVKTTSIWYANAQNAFWDFVIRYGFVTMTFLLLFLITNIHRYTKITSKKDNHVLWLSLMILYIYIFIGIGEIVYDKLFFFYITLIGALCIEKRLESRTRYV